MPAGFRYFWFVLFLTMVAAGGGASARAEGNGTATDRHTLLIMGDSLAAGYGVDPGEAFPALLQARIDEAQMPFEVFNAGLSGETSAGGVRRINWLLRRRVDVLLLELGGNDGLRGIEPSATRTNLQLIIDRTVEKNPGVRVVIAGMRMPENMGPQFTAQFSELFVDLARTNGAALIPFLLDGVGGDPTLNLADLIHPNRDGHQVVARNIWTILEPVLRESLAGKDLLTVKPDDKSVEAP